MRGSDGPLDFPVNEQTGYYLPIQFTGEKYQIIERQSNGKRHTFGDTKDTDTTMILILYVNKEDAKIEFKLYENEFDATGSIFYVDCTECDFS